MQPAKLHQSCSLPHHPATKPSSASYLPLPLLLSLPLLAAAVPQGG
jgi:hypothetical protein